MDNDAHARFQRMLLGEPEPEAVANPEPEPQPDSKSESDSESELEPDSEPQQQQQHQPPQKPSSAPPQQLHVDVNANLTPRPPTATPPPPPPAPTSARHVHAQPPTMVSVIQDQWLHLCDYFQRVQCANSHEERVSLVRELGIVEDSLGTILDALLTDRKQLVSTQLLHTHMSIFGESTHSDLGASSLTLAGTQSSSAANPHLRVLPAAATFTPSPMPSPASGFLLDGALACLPPCYRFLFADAHRDTLFFSEESAKEEEEENGDHTDGVGRAIGPQPHASTGGNATKAATKAYDDPSPIGSIFLLTLCQYAKQDEPPGVRSIILEFLVRLLQEADLPTDRAAYPAGDPVLSLLQLNPPLLIVPLLDMLRKVSKALDPSHTALRHGAASASASSAFLWAGSGAGEEDQDGTFLQDAGRTQLVIFLGSLAEKMERVPALANFFVVEDGAEGERSLFVLLDALLPYLTHDCSAPGWTHRRDTCRYALSAVVSLAKCPDPWIQDLVGKEGRVASRTLMAARTTLLTLCKIPENDDSATQVLFLRDVLRFWATLLTMSPSVAEDLQLAALVEKEFYFQTLLPLLQSSDTHVYAAACLVTAQVLRELNGSASVLTNGLAKALLATSIRKSSGRIIPHTEHYESVVTDDGGPGKADATATSLGQQEEAAAARHHLHPTTSFFLYYILPHLSSNPYMSAEERENSALLGYSTTRWSTTKATLMLVQALAENVPQVFMREVFLMDMNSLTDVLRKQQGRASQSPATTSQPIAGAGGNTGVAGPAGDSRMANLGLWSTETSPPHLKVHDYFVKELHETAATSAALGLQAERVGEEVLTRLLRTEGNMSMEALRARQEVMSAMAQPSSCSTAKSAASSTRPPPPAASSSRSASPLTATSNCWSHAGVQRSPLTVALCEMVQHLDATPFTVSSLVADLLVSLCVLPDLRVIYTLLDPINGPLKTALCQLRDVLHHKLSAKGVEVTLAPTAKKGASPVAFSSVSPTRPTAAAATHPGLPATTRVSLLILYDTLLQHWDAFTSDEDDVREEADEQVVAAGPASSAVSRDGTGGEVPLNPQGGGFPIAALRGAIEANSNVLHACLYSEYLLAHLDAVIGYSALSQNLMYLRTSC